MRHNPSLMADICDVMGREDFRQCLCLSRIDVIQKLFILIGWFNQEGKQGESSEMLS